MYKNNQNKVNPKLMCNKCENLHIIDMNNWQLCTYITRQQGVFCLCENFQRIFGYLSFYPQFYIADGKMNGN